MPPVADLEVSASDVVVVSGVGLAMFLGVLVINLRFGAPWWRAALVAVATASVPTIGTLELVDGTGSVPSPGGVPVDVSPGPSLPEPGLAPPSRSDEDRSERGRGDRDADDAGVDLDLPDLDGRCGEELGYVVTVVEDGPGLVRCSEARRVVAAAGAGRGALPPGWRCAPAPGVVRCEQGSVGGVGSTTVVEGRLRAPS